MDIKVKSRKAFFDLARRSIGLLMESKIIADIRGGNQIHLVLLKTNPPRDSSHRESENTTTNISSLFVPATCFFLLSFFPSLDGLGGAFIW